MRIFLIGFMGSGKSFTGKRLSEMIGYPFIDLDDWIVEKEQRSISEIFRTIGEDGFRKIERKALHHMIDTPKAVIATGGGTPCFFDNMKWMNENGLTVYLSAPISVLVKRLTPEKSHRPLLSGFNQLGMEEFISITMEKRTEFYEQAHVVIQQEENMDVARDLSQQLTNIIGH